MSFATKRPRQSPEGQRTFLVKWIVVLHRPVMTAGHLIVSSTGLRLMTKVAAQIITVNGLKMSSKFKFIQAFNKKSQTKTP